MKHVFVIGEKEKHEIEVDRSDWSPKAMVKVDGKIVSEKSLLFRRGVFSKFQIGKKEKHEVELKLGGFFPKIKCFVDGRPFLGKVIPSTGKAVSILLITVIGVGICSGLGGYLLGYSEMVKSYADLIDINAELFYDLGADDSAKEMRDLATEMRDTARELHDYGIYSIVGALLVAIGGAGWMARRFREKRE